MYSDWILPYLLPRFGKSGYNYQGNTVNGDRRPFKNHLLTLPGLKRFNGSMAALTVLIKRTVPSPSSSIRYSFLPRPIPCSPEPAEVGDHQLKPLLAMNADAHMFHPGRLHDEPSYAQPLQLSCAQRHL